MSNDKTLADVQPGGMVRLGDGLPPCPFCGHSDFDQWPCEYIDASGANVVRCAHCHAAAPMKVWHDLSAQPSPGATALGIPIVVDPTVPPDTFEVRQPSTGGQDALASLPLYRLADDANGNRGLHRDETGSWVKLQDVERALAACQPAYVQGCDELRARTEGERAAYMEGLEEGKKIAARQPVGDCSEGALYEAVGNLLEAPGSWTSGYTDALHDLREAYSRYGHKPVRQKPLAEVSRKSFNSDGTSNIITPALPLGTQLYADPPAQAVGLGQFNALAALANAVVHHGDESPMKNGVFAEAERLLALIDSQEGK